MHRPRIARLLLDSLDACCIARAAGDARCYNESPKNLPFVFSLQILVSILAINTGHPAQQLILLPSPKNEVQSFRN